MNFDIQPANEMQKMLLMTKLSGVAREVGYQTGFLRGVTQAMGQKAIRYGGSVKELEISCSLFDDPRAAVTFALTLPEDLVSDDSFQDLINRFAAVFLPDLDGQCHVLFVQSHPDERDVEQSMVFDYTQQRNAEVPFKEIAERILSFLMDGVV